MIKSGYTRCYGAADAETTVTGDRQKSAAAGLDNLASGIHHNAEVSNGVGDGNIDSVCSADPAADLQTTDRIQINRGGREP